MTEVDGGMEERAVTIRNKWGIHARSAFAMVKTAMGFSASITAEKDGVTADCKQVADLLTLTAACGDTVVIKASGADKAAALDAIESLIEAKFGED
ncbi:MAG: HPr family phosphocarrier protein [Nitrospinae bacterium]|nr:HPr family phosphocarrier protein [Nitrospinota bacterium]